MGTIKGWKPGDESKATVRARPARPTVKVELFDRLIMAEPGYLEAIVLMGAVTLCCVAGLVLSII